MRLNSCFVGGRTYQTLKHSSSYIPSRSSSSSSSSSTTSPIFRPLSKTLFLTFHPPSGLRRPVPFIVRVLSSLPPEAAGTIDDKVVKKAQWKAAIDFKWIRENKVAVDENIKNRNSSANLELVLQLYERVLNLQKVKEVERLRAERNVVASKMKGKVEPSERQKLIEEGKNLKDVLLTLEEDLLELTDELHQEAQRIPNMTHPNVPIGGEEFSTLRKMVGNPPVFTFPIKDHLELGKELDLFDFDAAAKVSGSKFCYFKNEAVALDAGLIRWAISEVYSIQGSDQCLVGTAEITIAGYHMNKLYAESSLPKKFVAVSTCYRTEAGAAGTASRCDVNGSLPNLPDTPSRVQDLRGLYRLHQFSKVEMFILCRPEDSESFHKELIGIEEDLFSSLGLHFITLDMASGDLGTPAYRKFDVEAWMPGLGRYGEISSASNCTDYQSRRIGTRYRPDSTANKPKKGNGNVAPQFVHTLNATACAIPRMIICLLENYQQEDGSVVIPEPLWPFMDGIKVIIPKKSK